MNKELDLIKDVINKEIDILNILQKSVNENYTLAIELIHKCKGKVIVSGIGKSGLIAKKISSTFSSLGIPSFFINSGEALHGDLGAIRREDVVILISYSGETKEVCEMIPTLLKLKAHIVAITGNIDSYLANLSDVVLLIPKHDEADELNLAPTCSTIAMLAIGDALAVTVSRLKELTKNEFLLYHPSGSLGKRLRGDVND